MTNFSHLNKKEQPGMVNVGSKKVTHRKALPKPRSYFLNIFWKRFKKMILKLKKVLFSKPPSLQE
jgi:cyclic pyranopterin phosphate synthase